jgi:hypothetical protein
MKTFPRRQSLDAHQNKIMHQLQTQNKGTQSSPSKQKHDEAQNIENTIQQCTLP